VHFSREGRLDELPRIVGELVGEERRQAVERSVSLFYPDDLKYTMAHPARARCCSTVRPGDVSVDHAMGSVGIMLRLKTPQSLRTVAKWDDGYMDDDRDMDITPADLADTMDDRPGGHNEWLLQDFDVVGIFALPPLGYFDIRREGVVQTDLAAIQRTFPDMDVYAFANGAIYRIRKDGSGGDLVEHSELYP